MKAQKNRTENKASSLRIALIGADGQLGSDLMKALEDSNLFPLYYPEFDVTDKERMQQTLEIINPDIIINTSAFNDVNECENKIGQAFELNSIAVRELSRICLKLKCVLVHFSSDYVFDGKKKEPYIESDKPNPLNVYGVSKLAGEYFVQNILDRYYVIRTSGLFGEAGCKGKGYNFVDIMVDKAEKEENIKVVNDQWMTPTWTFELAEKVKDILTRKKYGLYHMSSEGKCTWYEFAGSVFSCLGKKPKLIPVDSETYGAKARRPLYSVLENKKLKEIGVADFSNWKSALKKYMIKKGYLRN